MERTDFKKASYCKKRIEWAMERIKYAEKVKGIGPGTFWMDEKAVDEYIKEIENYITALENRIAFLRNNRP